jgi:hypothetical protein
VLKGAHLTAAVYRNPAFRPMQDMDVMVRRPDAPAAAALLESLGYSQEGGLPASRMPENGTLNSVFFRPAARIMPNVHLHWHIVNASYPLEFYASTMDVGRLWARARPLGEPFADAVCLAPEHLLLHLCEHAVKHCFAPLVLLCDMAATIRRFETGEEDFMDRFIGSTKEFGLSRPAFHALSFCEAIFPGTMPGPALARLHSENSGGMETAFARMVRSNIRLPAQNWLLYLSMCPSLKMKTRFLRRALFPGKEQLRALGNDPAGAQVSTISSHIGRLLRGARLLYTGYVKL